MEQFPALARSARLKLLEMHYNSGAGHIGGALSALDAMLVLHHYIMEDNDSFILSKGHAASALYVTLWSCGILSDIQLATYQKDNTKLSCHTPPNWITHIPFGTGSLGHGLPLASGIALGKRQQQQPGHVYCLMSDGEWQEGSNWEALIFLLHHRLQNLTILIDANGLQGLGGTAEIASLGAERLISAISGFGATVIPLDGHNPEAILGALANAAPGLRILMLNTIKGKGVSFMENAMEWHYLALTETQYRDARTELEA